MRYSFVIFSILIPANFFSQDFQVQRLDNLDSVQSIESRQQNGISHTWWSTTKEIDPYLFTRAQFQYIKKNHILASDTKDRSRNEIHKFKDIQLINWQAIDLPYNLFDNVKFKSSEISEAWYYKKFILPREKSTHIGLQLGQINDRDVVYLNGIKIGQTGVWDAKYPQAYDKSRIYKIPDNLWKFGEVNVLLIHVQKFTESEIGPVRGELNIGPATDLYRNIWNDDFIEILFLVVYLSCGGYFFFLYIRRRTEKENLLFALFIFIMVIYQALKTRFRFDFGMEMFTAKRLEYNFLYALFPLFYYFIRVYFVLPKNKVVKVNDWLAGLATTWMFISVIIVNINDDADFWWYLYKNFGQPVWLIYIISIISILIYKAKKKNVDAYYMILGFSFVLAGIIVDTLIVRGIYNFPPIMSYIFAGFIMSLALILANRFVRINEEVEDLNQNLELKVEQRTDQLNNSFSEIKLLKEQQDGDYYLTSLLVNPLGGNFADHKNLTVEMCVEQKKTFIFKRWKAEIGGDLCTANNLRLLNRDYIVFLNGDAMGKSLQGAGGALVLGTVFKSVVTRTQISSDANKKYPERWLKDCFRELQNVFISFDGFMLVSAILGLVDAQNGMLYYINAEHPRVVSYLDGKAEFLPEKNNQFKIGTALESDLRINTHQLRPREAIICGSDGRDDIEIGIDENGNRVINEDEDLFIQHVEKADGLLHTIRENILKSGMVTDDLSLLRVVYLEDAAIETAQNDPQYNQWISQARHALKEDDFTSAIDFLANAAQINKTQEALLLKAKTYRKMKDFTRAADAFEKYTDNFPADTEALFTTSVMYKYCRAWSKAADFGERFRLRLPADRAGLLNLVEIYIQLNNISRARSFLEQGLKENPSDSSAIKLQNIILKKQAL